MRKRSAVVVTVLSGLIASSVYLAAQTVVGVPQDSSEVGYLSLHKRHPDGADGKVEFELEYSSVLALVRLEQLRGFLNSFSQLTDQVRGRFDRAQLQAIGNTGSEIQTIGFHNIPLVIEGTLLKQEYQLTQARYALGQLKHDRQEITAAELARLRSAYQEATVKFQAFWDTKLPTD